MQPNMQEIEAFLSEEETKLEQTTSKPASPDPVSQEKLQNQQVLAQQDNSEQELASMEKVLFDPLGRRRSPLADGTDPRFAIPESPLTVGERLSLKGLGNEKGQEAWLKENFEGVYKGEDGRYSVKRDGAWFAVDPKDSAVGPWEATKNLLAKPEAMKVVATEALKDVADIAPEIAMAGASIGAAFMTGGSSLLVQGAALLGTGAGLSLLKTSMGKLEGTYDAPVEDQLSEAAFEAALNSVGVGFTAGKTGLSVLAATRGGKLAAKQIGKVSESKIMQATTEGLAAAAAPFKAMAQGTKNAYAEAFGKLSGIGEDALRAYMDEPDKYVKVLRQNLVGANTRKEVIEKMSAQNKADAVKLVKSYPQVRDAKYASIMQNIQNQLPANTSFDMAGPAKATLGVLEDMGIVKNGKLLPAKELSALASSADAPQLAKLLHTFEKTRPELDRVIKGLSAEMRAGNGKLMDAVKGERTLQRLFDNIEDVASRGEGIPPEFLNEIMSLKKASTNWIDNQVNRAITSSGREASAKPYLEAKSQFKAFADEFRDVEKLSKKVLSGRMPENEAADKLLNFASSKAGTQKGTTLARIKDTFSDVNPNFAGIADSIETRQVAERFVPWMPNGVVTFARSGAIAAAGAGAGAAVDEGSQGRGATVGAMAGFGLGAVSSPRLQGQAILALAGIKKARQFLMTRSLDQLETLNSNPQAASAFLNTAVRLPLTKEALEQELLQKGIEPLTQQGQGQ